MQDKILDSNNYQEVSPGYFIATFGDRKKRTVVSYSQKRAKKDAHDREVALDKLLKKLKKSKNPKSHFGAYGYRKYLKLKGASTIRIDTDKIRLTPDGIKAVGLLQTQIYPQIRS